MHRENNTVKQLLESDDLLVGISELSKVTGVSPRQIRYWEQKGFISSTGEKVATENLNYQW